MITTFPDGRVPSKNWSEKPGAGQHHAARFFSELSLLRAKDPLVAPPLFGSLSGFFSLNSANLLPSFCKVNGSRAS
jgi:hypothetical protein